MQLNLNVTLSIIISPKTTNAEHEQAMLVLESSIDRLQAKYGKTVSLCSQDSSSEVLDRNKAYLLANGRQRTPKVSNREFGLRSRIDDLTPINWQDLQSRHETLLAHGLDIFTKQVGNGEDVSGETFGGDVELIVPTED